MLEFFRRHRGAFLITLTITIIISMFYYGVSQATRNYEKKAQITTYFPPLDSAIGWCHATP